MLNWKEKVKIHNCTWQELSLIKDTLLKELWLIGHYIVLIHFILTIKLIYVHNWDNTVELLLTKYSPNRTAILKPEVHQKQASVSLSWVYGGRVERRICLRVRSSSSHFIIESLLWARVVSWCVPHIGATFMCPQCDNLVYR